MDMFITSIVLRFHGCVQMSKLTKLYTNMCSSFYVNYTSIKLLKSIRIFNHIYIFIDDRWSVFYIYKYTKMVSHVKIK